MILHGALAKMIDDTECLFFLNTPNSISVKQSVDKTYSPWIYSELLLSSIVRHKKLEEYRKHVSANSVLNHFNEGRNLQVEYDADTRHLIEIEMRDLKDLKCINGDGKSTWETMDNLYRQMGLVSRTIY